MEIKYGKLILQEGRKEAKSSNKETLSPTAGLNWKDEREIKEIFN